MAKRNKEKTYWPHMILGFLVLGITLSYWTVKSASSIPVQESNEFMMKYQQADMNINDILKKKAHFDQQYLIKLSDAQKTTIELENAKRAKSESVVLLKEGKNRFSYRVTDRNNNVVSDLNVTFLLTRPHTVKEDTLIENIPFKNGYYVISGVNISKPGRYVLQLKVEVDENTIGYSSIPAYLKPE
ncbi:FixH family protein [Sulfurovum sp. ST-21]|uniref:YtkA-like domain-containing protein n=1 Tax=Sulfurovum indicum TaxID=2779528 RepID=A0A7M1S3U5_9BACT|nr:FixH family protein [Sulfurovum indicum]QOR61732.1 hypothetical protein IMZ28_09915 [Sulfurovum indicum]